MEMNEILNGLNSCGSDDNFAPSCRSREFESCGNDGCGFGGCGFGGWWIWILLILFYSGGFGFGGNRGQGQGQMMCCCKKGRKGECCCEPMCCTPMCCDGGGFGGFGGVGLGNCTPYLFLLVILFLCSGSGFGGCGGGCGNFGLGGFC